MFNLHILAPVIFEGLANNILRLANGQLAGAFDCELAVRWSLEEEIVCAVHAELEVEVAILIRLLFDFAHKLEDL